ncbi:maleylpyruvate isomerase family mycothiol-dependent enzyme [Actinomycetospora endophytica]|uniref:Maleylpyruvate isomerase family mycothiol-dependent enzyme n=1 Tax=Actinomycetospora endophytica TaxID=2291215 RepID=A0ABS8PIF0_9PSEU|nr:maleylpyruvate isomerase family mycothiol-dependent enzyme [Actinomycetospora endophytica]MCD2197944.1 maleylpyruvate isomerase family mycothiol-dependent enzyme [Actinomycetospora endophytica]
MSRPASAPEGPLAHAGSPAPDADLDGSLAAVTAATERFVAALATLDDADVAGPTLIPPWTRGHVVTHVARAADSYRRLLAGAAEGREVPQYPSMEFRAEQIEAGARRPVAALIDDVTDASDAFVATMQELPDHAWDAQVRMRPGELRGPAALPWIRVREIEVHHVDLALGYGFADIPSATARWILDDILFEFARRDPLPPLRLAASDTDLQRELGPPAPWVRGTQAELLAWLSGRSSGEGLTRDDGSGPAPYWI